MMMMKRQDRDNQKRRTPRARYILAAYMRAFLFNVHVSMTANMLSSSLPNHIPPTISTHQTEGGNREQRRTIYGKNGRSPVPRAGGRGESNGKTKEKRGREGKGDI